MAHLILTPDQPCNWHKITQILQIWDPSLQQVSSPSKSDGHFSCTLPGTPQEMTTTLFSLQKSLEPLGISFSLEISP